MTTATRPARPRTGISVVQDGRGYWHFRRELPRDPSTGKRRRLDKSDRIKSKAREKFEAALAEYQRTGRIKTGESPLLRDWLGRWLDEYKRPMVKPRVYETYRSDCKNITAVIGSVRLEDLEPWHVREMGNRIMETRSGKTALNAYIRLRSALSDAVKEDLVDSNVCERCDPPRVSANPTVILQPGQPDRLIEAEASAGSRSKRHPWPDDAEDRRMWALMWRLAFTSGMRQGERFALTPSELVIRNGVHGVMVMHELQRYKAGAVIPAWLHASRVRGGIWSVPPKSRKGIRFIPLGQDLWDGLQDWIRDHDIGDGDLVFTRKGWPLTNPVERRRWSMALEEAGLPYVTIRSARHYFATRLAEAGAPEDARKDLMGHVSIDTTAGYTHWSLQTLAALVGKAGKTIEPTPETIDVRLAEAS